MRFQVWTAVTTVCNSFLFECFVQFDTALINTHNPPFIAQMLHNFPLISTQVSQLKPELNKPLAVLVDNFLSTDEQIQQLKQRKEVVAQQTAPLLDNILM